MDVAFAFDDGAVRLLLGAANMLFDHADTFNDNLLLGTIDLEDFSLGSAMVAGDDLDKVTGVNMCVNKLKSRHFRK